MPTFHPIQDERPVSLNGQVWEGGELVNGTSLTDFSWLEAYEGPEIVMDPFQLDELQADQLWEEMEADLDDWAPKETPRERLKSLGPWIDKNLNEEDRKTQRILFWNWWNGQGQLLRERLAMKDYLTVDETVEYMVELDQQIFLWNSNNPRPLLREAPSMLNELRREILAAQNRNRTARMIAMGEMQRITINGVVHIVPTKALERAIE
jgi:hypothetical protein